MLQDMRGRWASAALGAGMARRRMGVRWINRPKLTNSTTTNSTTNRSTAKANRSFTTTKAATTSTPITA